MRFKHDLQILWPCYFPSTGLLPIEPNCANLEAIHATLTEMQKVIKIAEINFWPTKISTKKWPKNDPKWPKNLHQLKNSTDISAASAAFCISDWRRGGVDRDEQDHQQPGQQRVSSPQSRHHQQKP